jgi:hypothetical protein
MKRLSNLTKAAQRMLVRAGLWAPAGPGAEAYAEMSRSVRRVIQADPLYNTFAELHPKIEDMSNGCLEWLRDQMRDLGDSPHVSKKMDALERQAAAISLTVGRYLIAWDIYKKEVFNTREHFPESLRSSANMLVEEKIKKIGTFRYSTGKYEEAYETVRAAAIDLAETVLNIMPKNNAASEFARDFLARTAEPRVPEDRNPPTTDFSPSAG